MPTFTNTSRRLVLRYASGNAFSFNHLLTDADDEAVYELAQAFASIQSDTPQRITTILTRNFGI